MAEGLFENAKTKHVARALSQWTVEPVLKGVGAFFKFGASLSLFLIAAAPVLAFWAPYWASENDVPQDAGQRDAAVTQMTEQIRSLQVEAAGVQHLRGTVEAIKEANPDLALVASINQSSQSLQTEYQQRVHSMAPRVEAMISNIMFNPHITERDMHKLDDMLQNDNGFTGGQYIKIGETRYITHVYGEAAKVAGYEKIANVIPALSFDNAFGTCRAEITGQANFTPSPDTLAQMKTCIETSNAPYIKALHAWALGCGLTGIFLAAAGWRIGKASAELGDDLTRERTGAIKNEAWEKQREEQRAQERKRNAKRAAQDAERKLKEEEARRIKAAIDEGNLPYQVTVNATPLRVTTKKIPSDDGESSGTAKEAVPKLSIKKRL